MDEYRARMLFRYNYPDTLSENCFGLPENTGKVLRRLFSNTLPIYPTQIDLGAFVYRKASEVDAKAPV